MGVKILGRSVIETPSNVSVVDSCQISAKVEEQYKLNERKALTVDTSGASYSITTSNPKLLILIVDGDDMYVDTQPISADSPKIKDGGSLSLTLGGEQITVYAKAVNTSGTLYILVFRGVS